MATFCTLVIGCNKLKLLNLCNQTVLTLIYPCMLNCIMHIRPVQLKLFYGKVPGRTFMSTGTKHLAPGNSHYENLASGVFPKGAIKMQIRNAYFRS